MTILLCHTKIISMLLRDERTEKKMNLIKHKNLLCGCAQAQLIERIMSQFLFFSNVVVCICTQQR